MKSLWVLIDDKRDLNCDITARTAEEGKRVLKEYKGRISVLCLDHDLGEEVNGYHVAVWAILNNCMPPKVQLVTSNPVGRKNIESLLRTNKYQSIDGINFEKEGQ